MITSPLDPIDNEMPVIHMPMKDDDDEEKVKWQDEDSITSEEPTEIALETLENHHGIISSKGLKTGKKRERSSPPSEFIQGSSQKRQRNWFRERRPLLSESIQESSNNQQRL